ncbi:sigma E protease regulator RseP [Pantoea sp. Nvir]|uniref:sigma E protease regulator RseP n=1 Tax=Pantoea sp. Nvir TaxID=2576760 RepID=UPI00135BBC34|nr:sigma E protease regulator RseP [Pantoea sp. Nvir]MXP66885.1 sigma E protease regulator RseP [Pantoea sp. Nvir]CAJ0991379.1 Regulator of sigma-E protease RseP [Pantoea sp. Nvir]
MLSMLWSFVAFIIAIGVLITVHECGHFLVARSCGVRVEGFSIGFGKAIWHCRDRRGTKYVIAMIPLGGYVKMLDERTQNVPPEICHQAFNNKAVWQRASIIAAGPVANFIFAVFAYWIVFLYGVPGIRPVVGEILNDSVAEKAQIISGMELKAVDGIETADWDAVRMALINKIGATHTVLTISNFGEKTTQQKEVDLQKWVFDLDKEDPILALGIRPYGPKIETTLTEVQENSPASVAGLQAGDRIIKVDGQLLTQWQTFVTQVRDHPGKNMDLEIDRSGEVLHLTLTPQARLGAKLEGFAGVVPHVIPLPNAYKIIKQYDIFAAISQASQKTWQLMKLTLSMLYKLMNGDVKINNLSGPISIAQGAGLSAEYGMIYYLMFLALISVNLGIINLFPLPVLDGGHLLFLAIEKMKGGPVSERVQNFSYRIGSILLVLLMGLALFNDFSRL